MIKRTAFILLFSLPFLPFSQEGFQDLAKDETQLSQHLQKLRSVTKDSSLKQINGEFQKALSKTLNKEGAFDYPFASLQSVGKIHSDDKLIRIFSWNIQYENGQHDYFSFIMKKDERRDKVHVVELKRKQQPYGAIQNETLDHENWYGALYYEVIATEKGNRTYYTLLGYDAHNDRSTIKLLDVLFFTGKYPKFGYPLFETENGYANRVIFEHSSKASMSLKYDSNREMIIFDHLSPETPGLKEFKEYYVPDMSYDAYTFQKNKWRLEEDIIANNKKKSEELSLKAYDSDLDTVVTIRKKDQWINPEDKNAPLDGGGHKAVTPEDLEAEKNVKESKQRADKNKRPKKEGFSGVSYSNLNGKKDKKKRRNRK